MATTTTFAPFAVYTLTPRGSFSQKYDGTDEMEALKAYDALVAKNKPRCFVKREQFPTGTVLASTVMRSEDFPQ
jgi:hypothetical protein